MRFTPRNARIPPRRTGSVFGPHAVPLGSEPLRRTCATPRLVPYPSYWTTLAPLPAHGRFAPRSVCAFGLAVGFYMYPLVAAVLSPRQLCLHRCYALHYPYAATTYFALSRCVMVLDDSAVAGWTPSFFTVWFLATQYSSIKPARRRAVYGQQHALPTFTLRTRDRHTHRGNAAVLQHAYGSHAACRRYRAFTGSRPLPTVHSPTTALPATPCAVPCPRICVAAAYSLIACRLVAMPVDSLAGPRYAVYLPAHTATYRLLPSAWDTGWVLAATDGRFASCWLHGLPIPIHALRWHA